jgi:hypothetical protein
VSKKKIDVSFMINYENLIMVLYIFDKIGRKSGKLSTAKLLFLAEEDFYRRKIIGPKYKFRKYPMGPYDKLIGTHIEQLGSNDCLGSYKHYYHKTKRDEIIYYSNEKTTKIIKALDDLIQENSEIFNIIDSIIDRYKNLNSEELMELVYSLDKVGINNKPVNRYRNFGLILDPQRVNNPKKVFKLDEEWYDTIEILLNPDLNSLIEKGLRNLKYCEFKPL